MTPATMASLLERNMAVLRRRFPALVPLVESFGGVLPASVEVSESRHGSPTVCVGSEAGKLHVHSSFNPHVEAERWAKQPLTNTVESAFIVGMGLGYHLEVLIEQQPNRRMVVFEPNPDVFFAALACRDQRKLLSHPRLELLVTSDPRSAADLIYGAYLTDLLDGCPTFVWPPTSRYAPQFLPTFQARLTDLLRVARGDLATTAKFSLQWMDNFFANAGLSVADPGVAALFGPFANRPAIVVSAGPSLDKNAHLLRRAEGKAVLIAAGSAINALLKHSIEPDLLVSFDPGKPNYRHFKDLRAPSVPLVYVPTIYAGIIQEYDGPRFASGMEGLPFVTWLLEQVGDDKGTLATGPSVANASWYLAARMGLDPVILVGQDLAYTDMKTHADGAAHARPVNISPEQIGHRYLMMEDIYGESVYTNRPMHAMKLSFEHLLSQDGSKRVTVDATEGGVKIAGTRIMTLADALSRYCTDSFEPHPVILSIHQEEQRRLDATNPEERLGFVYGQLAQQMRAIVELADEAIQDGNRLSRESTTRRLNEKRYKEAVIRLDRLITRLVRLPAFTVFVEPVIEHVLSSIKLSLQMRWEKETELYAQGRELARQYTTLFTTVRDTARHIQRLITDNHKALV